MACRAQGVSEEISKKSGPGDGKRKVPKVSGAASSWHEEGSYADMADAGSQPTSPRTPSQQGTAEHFVLIKLPEPVNDTIARKWIDGVSAQLGPRFYPARTVYLPFHDCVTVHFDSAADATDGALARRKLEIQYSTRAGTQMEVGVILDRPPPVQRQGRGLYPFYQCATGQPPTGAEVLRQIHRARGAHPHSKFYAEHSASRDIRTLFTVR